jgi:predicted transposase YbfD/YdcC
VFRIHRRRFERGKWTEEWAHGITSLSEKEASAADLLARVRAHWSIENSLHHVRDVTFHEDRCRARSRNLAQLLAIARNLAITILRRAGYQEIPEGLEDFAEDRARAVRAIRYGKTE